MGVDRVCVVYGIRLAMIPKFIGEIGSNHGGDLTRARRLIEAAAGAGFDAVKVQCFDPDKMFRPGTVTTAKHFPCPVGWLPELAELSHSFGMEFGATVCNLEMIEAVAKHCDYLKVGSYELLCHDLIRACCQTDKPFRLSTGMATLAEIQSAFDIAQNAWANDLILFHCVSIYPCPI